jgi:chromosome segregation ATPase
VHAKFVIRRKECAHLQEKMTELQMKVKGFVAQSKITAAAEVKILLTKVDAVYNQIAQLERSQLENHKRISALEQNHQNQKKKLGAMVPAEQLDSHKEELSKKESAMNEMYERLRVSQEEIDKLKQKLQVCT